jgi:DNA-binding LacI/PurR family transcriptional regulator
MPTLKELAKIAKVSISTVSKALNNSNDISEDTKLRIVELAIRNGYIKTKKKQNPNTENGPVIAVIYSDITSNYYSRLMDIFDSHIAKMEGLLLMSCAEFETKRIIQLCRFFESIEKVDGIICVSPFNVFGDIPQSTLPMVGLSYPSFETHPFDYICVDDGVGIDEGIACFKKHGHSKIAFLSEGFTPHRLQFFKDSMKRQGLTTDPSLIRVSDKRFEQAGYEMMLDILAKGNIPTAVFAAYDDIAVGASKAIFESGLSIPEDISIAGIDNTMCLLNGHNLLASVNCHMEEQVDIAINLLMKKVNEPGFKVFQNVNLRTSFVEHSTIASVKR